MHLVSLAKARSKGLITVCASVPQKIHKMHTHRHTQLQGNSVAMGQQTQLAYGTQALHTQVKFAILPFLCSLYPLLSGAKKKIAQLSLLTRHRNNKDVLMYGRTFMNFGH